MPPMSPKEMEVLMLGASYFLRNHVLISGNSYARHVANVDRMQACGDLLEMAICFISHATSLAFSTNDVFVSIFTNSFNYV